MAVDMRSLFTSCLLLNLDKINVRTKLSRITYSVLRSPQFFTSSRSFSDQPPFPVLTDSLSTSLPLNDGAERTKERLIKLENLMEISRQGGGVKAQELYMKRKMLPRKRLDKLWDKESDMFEIGALAGFGQPYADVPGASIIIGVGKVYGRYCLGIASDGTLKGGSVFPISVRKQLYAMELAENCLLPIVSFLDSGGAFLPLQSEFFPDKDGGGRFFYNEAVFGSKGITTVANVCGSCTAGGAYAPTMSEEASILDKVGTMFLGGPPLVKAALGEEISAEDLGGATLHCSRSGALDYFVTSEEEGIDVLRDNIATTVRILPGRECEYGRALCEATESVEPLYSADTLDALSGLDYLDRSGMLAVVSRLADGSRFREFKQKYGENLIAGYCFIERKLVGVLANCGPLTYEDGLKGAHFLQLCQHRDLPVLFLQNCGSEAKRLSALDGRGAEFSAALRGRAAMSASLACLDTPKLAVNVMGLSSDDNFTMCGSSFKPTFSLSWPSGFVLYDHNNFGFQPNPAVDEMLEPQGRSMFRFPPGSCWYNAANSLCDAIIPPRDTRKVVSLCLDIASQKFSCQFKSKRFPVYRF